MWGQDSPLDGIAILFYLFSFEEELTCLENFGVWREEEIIIVAVF